MEKPKLTDYDTLECIYCESQVKPSKIHKDGSCTYNCKECNEKFTIEVDGNLKE